MKNQRCSRGCLVLGVLLQKVATTFYSTFFVCLFYELIRELLWSKMNCFRYCYILMTVCDIFCWEEMMYECTFCHIVYDTVFYTFRKCFLLGPRDAMYKRSKKHSSLINRVWMLVLRCFIWQMTAQVMFAPVVWLSMETWLCRAAWLSCRDLTPHMMSFPAHISASRAARLCVHVQ